MVQQQYYQEFGLYNSKAHWPMYNKNTGFTKSNVLSSSSVTYIVDSSIVDIISDTFMQHFMSMHNLFVFPPFNCQENGKSREAW
jgi:hypothetical protein